jgi:crotonobetainyl-CoA:carnitine CoA-transferase CaiB-like acyl-CoA transferase
VTSLDDDPAYAGLKVLDLSQGVAGPHCGMLLARHGADVVKLEPLDGDWGRAIGQRYGDQCAYSLAFNRGKKSLALDLKAPAGTDIAMRLAEEADVILQNYRPGVIERLGLDHARVTQTNPSVVYLSLTGFGQKGPSASLPATDSVMQAYSGLMAINRDGEGLPQRIGILAIDIMTGLYAFQAIAPALYRRAAKGLGAHIETSLMEAVGAFQSAKMIEHALGGGGDQRLGVPVAMFEAEDGYININGRRDNHFAALCEVLGLPELASDPRFATVPARYENEAVLMGMLREAVRNWTVADIAAALNAADVLNAPVHDYGDYFEAPQVKETEAVSWLEVAGIGRLPFPRLPGFGPAQADDPRYLTPHIGEHSAEVLGGLGYSKDQIRALAVDGAIGLGAREAGAG